MGSQEEGLFRKRDFQKRTDDDIDAFLGKKEVAKTTQAEPASAAVTPQPVQTLAEPAAPREVSDEEHEAAIRAARSSRAAAEAYHDVAVLRKKGHNHSHKAAQFHHKYKHFEAKAQKCQARAVAYREKSAARLEGARDYRESTKDYDAELKGAATGKSDLSPEALRTKMASSEKRAAKQDEISRKYDKKAAAQTEKGAKYRSKALKFLEKSKIHEGESRMYAKRADNLEKAG